MPDNYFRKNFGALYPFWGRREKPNRALWKLQWSLPWIARRSESKPVLGEVGYRPRSMVDEYVHDVKRSCGITPALQDRWQQKTAHLNTAAIQDLGMQVKRELLDRNIPLVFRSDDELYDGPVAKPHPTEVARMIQEGNRGRDLVVFMGQDSKVRGFSTRGVTNLNYPYDRTNLVTPEDLLGAVASQLRTTPMSPYEAWQRNGMYRAAVNMRARSIASIPFIISKKKRVLYNSEFDHEYPKELMWMRGNKVMGHVDFKTLIANVERSVMMYGRAAAGMHMDTGVLLGLFWWSPVYWSLMYDNTTSRIEYIQRTHIRDQGMNPGTGTQWPPEYVALFFNEDPFCEVGSSDGSTEGRTAAFHASVLHGMDRFLNAHMERGLLKATIVKLPQGTDEDEREEFSSLFGRVLGGSSQRHLTIEAETVDVTEIGEGLKEISEGSVEKQQAEMLLTAFGIPHGIMMSGQINSKATAEEDNFNLFDKTSIPRGKLVEQGFNEEIFNPMGLNMAFQYDRLDVRKKMRLREAESYQKFTGGKQIMSTQFAREQMGYHDLDTYLEAELLKDQADKERLLDKAPGGGEGNNPGSQDPTQEVSREASDDADQEEV